MKIGKHRTLRALLTGILAGAMITAARYLIHIGHGKMQALLANPVAFSFVYIAFACVIYFLLQKEPLIAGGKIPDVRAQTDALEGKWRSVILYKFFGAVLTLSSGLTMGIEGPSVQIGGFTGQMLAGEDDARLRHDLVGAGVAGALGAAFQAPLTGILFAMEAVHHSMRKSGMITAMLGGIGGTVVSSAFFGDSPVVMFTGLTELGTEHIVPILTLAVLLGAFGALFQILVVPATKLMEKLPRFARTCVPFAVTAAALFAMPALFGSGEHLLMDLVGLGDTAGLLFVLKFLLLVLCAASGLPGGIFFPVLVLGALGGTALGSLFVSAGLLGPAYLVPFALVAMAGFFSAIVRTPLTAVALVLEMTGAFTMLLPLVTVSIVAALIARFLVELAHVPQPVQSLKEE